MRCLCGDGYELDDDPARLNVNAIGDYLLVEAYWHRWRTRADIEEQLRCAWRCLGLYTATGQQVGFARAVSDGVALGYLADVYVLAPHRGRGLGRALVAEMVDTPTAARMRWLLHTADMHALYAGLGFGPPPESLIERAAPTRDPTARSGTGQTEA